MPLQPRQQALVQVGTRKSSLVEDNDNQTPSQPWVLQSEDERFRFFLSPSKQSWSIGRWREKVDLWLDDGGQPSKASRVHAHLQWDAAFGAFSLLDHASANGTYVNGRRIRHSHLLQAGDHIGFGSFSPLHKPHQLRGAAQEKASKGGTDTDARQEHDTLDSAMPRFHFVLNPKLPALMNGNRHSEQNPAIAKTDPDPDPDPIPVCVDPVQPLEGLLGLPKAEPESDPKSDPKSDPHQAPSKPLPPEPQAATRQPPSSQPPVSQLIGEKATLLSLVGGLRDQLRRVRGERDEALGIHSFHVALLSSEVALSEKIMQESKPLQESKQGQELAAIQEQQQVDCQLAVWAARDAMPACASARRAAEMSSAAAFPAPANLPATGAKPASAQRLAVRKKLTVAELMAIEEREDGGAGGGTDCGSTDGGSTVDTRRLSPFGQDLMINASAQSRQDQDKAAQLDEQQRQNKELLHLRSQCRQLEEAVKRDAERKESERERAEAERVQRAEAERVERERERQEAEERMAVMAERIKVAMKETEVAMKDRAVMEARCEEERRGMREVRRKVENEMREKLEEEMRTELQREHDKAVAVESKVRDEARALREAAEASKDEVEAARAEAEAAKGETEAVRIGLELQVGELRAQLLEMQSQILRHEEERHQQNVAAEKEGSGCVGNEAAAESDDDNKARSEEKEHNLARTNSGEEVALQTWRAEGGWLNERNETKTQVDEVSCQVQVVGGIHSEPEEHKVVAPVKRGWFSWWRK